MFCYRTEKPSRARSVQGGVLRLLIISELIIIEYEYVVIKTKITLLRFKLFLLKQFLNFM